MMVDETHIVHTYARTDAIEDGQLVDVSETAKEAGVHFRTALTRAVWSRYVTFDARCIGQDEAGRLWDILWMFRAAARRGGSEIHFTLLVAMPNGDWRANERPPQRGSGFRRERHREVMLKAVCGPGDYAEPVITIMLPEED